MGIMQIMLASLAPGTCSERMTRHKCLRLLTVVTARFENLLLESVEEERRFQVKRSRSVFSRRNTAKNKNVRSSSSDELPECFLR